MHRLSRSWSLQVHSGYSMNHPVYYFIPWHNPYYDIPLPTPRYWFQSMILGNQIIVWLCQSLTIWLWLHAKRVLDKTSQSPQSPALCLRNSTSLPICLSCMKLNNLIYIILNRLPVNKLNLHWGQSLVSLLASQNEMWKHLYTHSYCLRKSGNVLFTVFDAGIIPPVCNTHSNPIPINCGVLQGSKVSLEYFLFYHNDKLQYPHKAAESMYCDLITYICIVDISVLLSPTII